MKKKSRTANTAADAPVPTTVGTSENALAGSSGLPLVIAVATLIVCYVAIFYSWWDFRQNTLLMLFAPEQIVRGWFGADDELPLGLFDRVPLILVAMCIVAIAWATGSLVVRGSKLDERLTRLECELFSTGVGLSLWSLWTLLIGLLGLLSQTWLLWLPAVVSTGLAGFQLKGRSDASTAVAEPNADVTVRDDGLSIHWLWLGLPFALVFVLAGVLPPHDFDVLEYHLQAPKEWYQAGQITFLPHNIYANMPLGAEMFALLPMTIVPGDEGWWQGALIGKTVMAVVGVLTALVLYTAGKRCAGSTAGVVAALAYLSTPWTYVISTSGLIEGVLSFYFLLAVYAVWLWRREPETTESNSRLSSKWRLLLLAGFLAGSAAAVKYPALLFVVFPLALAVTWGYRRLDWKAGPVFILGALAGCGLWYAKNAVLTGNPVYPLAYGVFGGETRTSESHAQWQKAHAIPADSSGARFSIGQFMTSATRVVVSSEWLSPLLIPLALLSALAVSQRKTAFWLAVLLAYFLLAWWLFTHRLDRFWVPALVLVAWLAGLGATWSRLAPWRTFLAISLVACLLANFLLITSWLPVPGAQESLPLNRYFVGLDALRNVLQTPAHRYLNEHVPAGYNVLLVGDAQPFDLRSHTLYNTCFDDVVFDQLFQDKTREGRQAALREQKIAYIYFDWSEIGRYRSPGNYGFSEYVTPELVHKELAGDKPLLRKVTVPELEDSQGELYEVLGVVLKPE